MLFRFRRTRMLLRDARISAWKLLRLSLLAAAHLGLCREQLSPQLDQPPYPHRMKVPTATQSVVVPDYLLAELLL